MKNCGAAGKQYLTVVARIFFGRQKFTFDKGGKFSAGRGWRCGNPFVLTAEKFGE